MTDAVTPPVWVKEAALIADAVKVPTEDTVIFPKVFPPPPTAPAKVMLPVPELREMFPAEAEPRVLEKLMAEFCVPRVTIPGPRVVALAKVMVAPEPVLVMSPEVVIPPAPVKDTAPCAMISPVALIVRVPVSALSVTTGEPVVVVTAPFKTMLSATKFNPATAL